MIAVPISISDAREVVRIFHRHHQPPLSGLFAVGATNMSHVDQPLCGVAIIGRPVARGLDDGWTAEVTRLATDGCENVCSFLYAASWRAARALGDQRLVTYTLETEKGTSLLAAGWKEIARVRGRSWNTPKRPRIDKHPTQAKIRWEITR